MRDAYGRAGVQVQAELRTPGLRQRSGGFRQPSHAAGGGGGGPG